MLSASAIAQSSSAWVEIKDPGELRALLSNKTLRGNGWVAHFRSDGKGIFILEGRDPSPRTWEVKGTDQACFTRPDAVTNCYRYQRVLKTNQIVSTNVQTGGSAIFTVEDGIPKF